AMHEHAFPWKVWALVRADFAGSSQRRLQQARSPELSISHVVSYATSLYSKQRGALSDGLSEKSVQSTPTICSVYSAGHAEAGPVIRMGRFFQHIPASIQQRFSDRGLG